MYKNSTSFSIHKATKEDAAAILAYMNQVGKESDFLLFGENEFTMSLEQEEIFIDSTNSTDTSALFIGKYKDEIVCLGSISSSDRKRIAHHGELAITVRKKFWNQGIGTKLMEHIIDFAKNTGTLEILHLGVREDNEKALKLYRKMGFVPIGTFQRYFKINETYYNKTMMNLYL